MQNEAYKNEINRVNFNKVVRKQVFGEKKRNRFDDTPNKLLGATDRPDSDDDENISKMSDESLVSAVGSDEFATERSEDFGGKPVSNAKGAKSSELVAKKDNTKKAALE